MLKTSAKLECVVNEKIGHFYCDNDTPIPVAKEMLFQFQKYLGQLEDSIKSAEETKKAQEEADKLQALPEPPFEV